MIISFNQKIVFFVLTPEIKIEKFEKGFNLKKSTLEKKFSSTD